MGNMPRVVHFDLAADDPQRAADFYRTVFGWQIEKWDGPMDYWLIMTGPEDDPGIDGGLGKRGDPGQHTTNTIDVDSLDAYVEKVVASGGTVVMPRHAVPGVGHMALCTDTEGNTFGMMESDPEAR
jgi:predicted enzyme related to lactoylglutathione lyase